MRSPTISCRRRSLRLVSALTALALVAGCASQPGPARRTAPSTTARSTTAAPTTVPLRTATSTTSSSTPPPVRPPVLTRDGRWWGVDSYSPITAASLANVKGWYVGGHRPQFWGRYLSGRAGVHDTELGFARAHGIFVYLIVPDRNCSACSGGDACTNDSTADQARDDARDALRAARRLRIPAGAVLFKDIEQVSSCRDEPTPEYLLAWYRTVVGSPYRVGFYGNVNEQTYEFPTAYCAAVRMHPEFGAGVVLAMNEPEPQLGAPRRTIGPGNAPAFRPSSPDCAPPGSTVIWQYGESTDPANVTDVDEAVPGTHGLLAPGGGVS